MAGHHKVMGNIYKCGYIKRDRAKSAVARQPYPNGLEMDGSFSAGGGALASCGYSCGVLYYKRRSREMISYGG
jgi:hypothetical protein